MPVDSSDSLPHQVKVEHSMQLGQAVEAAVAALGKEGLRVSVDELDPGQLIVVNPDVVFTEAKAGIRSVGRAHVQVSESSFTVQYDLRGLRIVFWLVLSGFPLGLGAVWLFEQWIHLWVCPFTVVMAFYVRSEGHKQVAGFFRGLGGDAKARL